MGRVLVLACWAFHAQLHGALMQFETIGSQNPGFFFFTIDGKAGQKLLCDEFSPNVTSLLYNSNVVTLADVLVDNAAANFTTLRQHGVSASMAFTFYSYVAYLDAKAYAGQALAADVVLANRWMIDGLKEGKSGNFVRDNTTGGTGPLTNGAMALLQEVQSLAVVPFNTAFQIYTSPVDRRGFRLTQEQTGFAGVPEPSAVILQALGLGVIVFISRRPDRAHLKSKEHDGSLSGRRREAS